jgi:phosphatidylglycerophosphate synthase
MGLSIWIDASSPESALRVFGMTLLERQLAVLHDEGMGGLAIGTVSVEHAAGAPPSVRPELVRALDVRFTAAQGPLGERVARAVRESASPLLLLSADSVLDTRLLAALARERRSCVSLAGEGGRRTAVLRLARDALVAGPEARTLCELGEALLRTGGAVAFPPEAIAAHITKLRRDLPVYAFRVAGEREAAEAERFLFWSNYKGSTDFLTRWVFPPFVWAMVRPLARWRVHPNWVTALDVAIGFGVIPVFAAAAWWPAFALSYLMAVLDSVDGKLARLTYRSTWIGDIMDHGLDLIHPPLWYIAWAWGLAGGPRGPLFALSLAMLGIYALDRLLALVFKLRTGRSIHGYAPIDVTMRSWISRRNVNLPVFTLGVALGYAEQAFVAIVAWQAACLVFHALRIVQVPRLPRPGPAAS